jgi:hypothetical protein
VRRVGRVGRVGRVRRLGTRAGLVALITILMPAWAGAQDRFDVGAHVAVTRSSEFDATDTGVGGWLAWHPSALVGAEAELTFYPASFPNENGFSSSRIEGLFGVTVGPRLARVRPFARFRPGFLTFRGQPVVCILIFPPPLSCELAAGRTVFAIDVGGGVEFFPTGRMVIRADVGDRVVKYPGPSFRNGRTSQDSFYSHDFRVSAGAGVRF